MEKILEEFISEIKKFGRKKASRKSGVSYMSIVNWCKGTAIFGQMTDIDYKEKVKKLQKTY